MHPTPRRPRLPQSLLGSGDLVALGAPPELGGSGQQLLDLRPKGFWALITGQPDAATNAYAFERVDDGLPLTFPALAGDALVVGDGDSLAAYEVTGRTDVPADSSVRVWLEPLRNAVGYGFLYESSTTVTTAMARSNGVLTPLTADDVWTDIDGSSSGAMQLTLPGAGLYLVSLSIYGFLRTDAELAAGDYAALLVRLTDGAGGTYYHAAMGAIYAGQIRGYFAHTPALPVEVASTVTLTVQGQRVIGVAGGQVIAEAVMGFSSVASGVAGDTARLSYLKLS